MNLDRTTRDMLRSAELSALTPGERFESSRAWWEHITETPTGPSGVSRKPIAPTEVASAVEFARLIRAQAFPWAGPLDAVPDAKYRPSGGAMPPVDVVPIGERRQVHARRQDGLSLAEEVDGADPLPLAGGFSSERVPTARFGLAAKLDRDDDTAASVIDRALRLGMTAGLARKVVEVVNAETTEVVNASSLEAAEAAAEAQARVGENGFTSFQVVTHPRTLSKVFPGRSVRDELPDVTAWIPSLELPEGVALLGDYNAGAVLHLGPVVVAATRSDEDDFRKGILTFSIETQIFVDAQYPDGFVRITNLS